MVAECPCAAAGTDAHCAFGQQPDFTSNVARLVRPDGAPQSRSRVAAVPFSCAGLGRHDRRPQFRSRRVGSGTYARTPHFIRSGKRMMNPSRFGIRTLGNVSALSVSFSPMSLFAAKM